MWWVKQRVLGVERARQWVTKMWDWEVFWFAILFELLGALVSGLLGMIPLAMIYGKPDNAPNAATAWWVGGIFGTANVIGWWIYLDVWAKLLEWARTGEKVVERLQGR